MVLHQVFLVLWVLLFHYDHLPTSEMNFQVHKFLHLNPQRELIIQRFRHLMVLPLLLPLLKVFLLRQWFLTPPPFLLLMLLFLLLLLLMLLFLLVLSLTLHFQPFLLLMLLFLLLLLLMLLFLIVPNTPNTCLLYTSPSPRD